MLEFFLILSLVLNIGMGWYVVQLVRRFLSVSEDLDEFFDALGEHSDHLEMINTMESYYGDATLQNLYDVDYEPQEEEDEDLE